jgi:hypothetical protein
MDPNEDDIAEEPVRKELYPMYEPTIIQTLDSQDSLFFEYSAMVFG